MSKLYMNFKGAEGVETIDEYDPAALKPEHIEGERARLEQELGRPVTRMTATHANRRMIRRDLGQYAQPGYYISTRCTKEWRAK